MSGAYYNEIDPYAAQWLRNLIAAGHIAPGDVDERSIVDVQPADLTGYTQCHFFAGIGVWSYALRRAGWPDDRPAWTGSCPCQPFSAAGKGEGVTDPRHLWPAWFRLIRERRPHAIFGEQVASAIRHGWLDLVSADLESLGYAIGAQVMGAHSVGAPHIRQRCFFVADPESSGAQRIPAERRPPVVDPDRRGETCGLEFPESEQMGIPGRARLTGSAAGLVGNTDNTRPQGRGLLEATSSGNGGSQCAARTAGTSFWSDCDWLPCIDGKARPVEPGTFPLAHGAPARVGRLRAYGNAIIAPCAEEFIRAYQ